MGKNFEALGEKANKQVKLITAAEARKLANTSIIALNRIFKAIRDGAAEGLIQIEWSWHNMSGFLKSDVKQMLENAGYNVKWDIASGCLIISW